MYILYENKKNKKNSSETFNRINQSILMNRKRLQGNRE